MSNSTVITNALYLPAPDIEALIQGREIVALPQLFLNPGRSFALCPSLSSSSTLPDEKYYRDSFLPIAKTALSKLDPQTASIKAWAKCEGCKGIARHEDLEPLSKLAIWTKEALERILLEREHIFLAFLRVHLLPNPINIPANYQGHFLALPTSQYVSDSSPVVETSVFLRRKKQIEVLEPPCHSELEELHSSIFQLAVHDSNAKGLENDLSLFLGWSSDTSRVNNNSEINWINRIVDVGNSSDGNEFEKLVRKSLIELGFSNTLKNSKASLDPNSTGGAGGIDAYCDVPYSLVGECKASKSQNVPSDVCSQLTYLGQTHLDKIEDGLFSRSIKIIFAAGNLTEAANNVAIGNKMNVLRPETIQRLVELKVRYPGSINLWELKPCLENPPFGEESNQKVNHYIDTVHQEISIRSHIIKLVKQHIEKTKEKDAEVSELFTACLYSHPPKPIDKKELINILIELSSPLTGYLGRRKGEDGNDRFYFLRDLIID